MTKETSTPAILGLTQAENKILDSIEVTPLSISNIARSTKIPRTSLLYMLGKLSDRELVVTEKRGKRTLWRSNSAVAMKQIPSNDVIVYRDVDAIYGIIEKWKSLPKNTRISAIQPDKSIRLSLRKNSLENWLSFNESLKQNAIIIEGIVHEKSVNSIIAQMGRANAQKIFDSFIGRLEDYVKIPDEFADVESEIYICKGLALIINWNKEVAIAINNKDMVDLLMAMLTCVKEMGTRYSQNEKMKLYKELLKGKLASSPIAHSPIRHS